MDQQTLTVVASVLGSFVTGVVTVSTAYVVTQHNAKLARLAELAREQRAQARERVKEQNEARALFGRFFRRNIDRGDTWTSDAAEQDEAYRVGGVVAAAFEHCAFGNGVINRFLVHVMSWRKNDPPVYTHSKLWTLFDAIDNEMIRVIEASMLLAGSDPNRPNRPQLPAELLT